MLVVETVARIRRVHFVQGKGIKEIARELGIARNTVRKVLRSGETAFAYEREVQPRPKLGAWTDELERRLNANSRLSRRERLGLIRIYEDLRVQGYQGGYDAVRRYARARERRHGTVRIPTKSAGGSNRSQPPDPSETSRAFRLMPARVAVRFADGLIELRSRRPRQAWRS